MCFMIHLCEIHKNWKNVCYNNDFMMKLFDSEDFPFPSLFILISTKKIGEIVAIFGELFSFLFVEKIKNYNLMHFQSRGNLF